MTLNNSGEIGGGSKVAETKLEQPGVNFTARTISTRVIHENSETVAAGRGVNCGSGNSIASPSVPES
jgi:hypothetical protein